MNELQVLCKAIGVPDKTYKELNLLCMALAKFTVRSYPQIMRHVTSCMHERMDGRMAKASIMYYTIGRYK